MPETRTGRAAVLARVPIFSDLSDTELKFLSDRAVTRRYTSGELIFSEGDPCAGLYIVESGDVRIFKTSAGGREHVLTIEHAGSSVAELPVFDGGNYLASHIGTVRELVSRNLSRFQAEGLIAMDGKNITIPNLARLEAEIQAQD